MILLPRISQEYIPHCQFQTSSALVLQTLRPFSTGNKNVLWICLHSWKVENFYSTVQKILQTLCQRVRWAISRGELTYFFDGGCSKSPQKIFGTRNNLFSVALSSIGYISTNIIRAFGWRPSQWKIWKCSWLPLEILFQCYSEYWVNWVS